MADKETRSSSDIDSGDEIVISGIAGRFPNSDNMNQLRENLFNKVDLVTADHNRWEDHPDISSRIGVINNVTKFDTNFFELSFDQAHTFSPEGRILLEKVYEAIIDAGINPKQLRGKNTAVIIGIYILDSQVKFLYNKTKISGLNIIGTSKSTVANMISFYFDLKGPSYTVDTSCSSTLYATALGHNFIKSGKCEDAIIGSTNLCLTSMVNRHFTRMGIFKFFIIIISYVEKLYYA